MPHLRGEPLFSESPTESVSVTPVHLTSFGALALIPLFYQSRREQGAPALGLRTPNSLP